MHALYKNALKDPSIHCLVLSNLSAVSCSKKWGSELLNFPFVYYSSYCNEF